MPLLDARHDLPHPVEGDTAWSESYYFNGYDALGDTGLFTRIGIRPNEGTMDVGLSVWLPGGGLAEYRARTTPPEAVGPVLEVGDVRYERLEAGRTWRLAGACVAPTRGTGPRDGEDVRLAFDLRFEAITPAIGTDGQGSRGPRSAAAAAAAGTVGKGHFEQAGRWTGWLEVDGTRVPWSDALGNRDRSWGPRRWGGPRMWRWFSLNLAADVHLGGILLGTDAGELHRGWVYDAGRTASVAEWGVRTELAEDGLTQRVVHLEVRDKTGRTYPLRGDVLRVADIGAAGGTVVNEGLARWTRLDDDAAPAGFGICEYLHQLDRDGRPVVAVA